jgi:hypothetical protein
MSSTDAIARPTGTPHPRPWRRPVLRWLVSFAGFPLGGLIAWLLVGPVDGLAAALAGGLVTGAVLGAFQAWALHEGSRRAAGWIVATAVGLMVGLAVGASLVQFGTGFGDLVLQGAVSGAAVGVAQAVLLRRLGPVAFAWPVALSVIWAAAWAVTAAVGIQVDEQFTVFGSSGAVLATILTTVLPVLIGRRQRTEKSGS